MTVTIDGLPPSIRVGPYDIAIQVVDKINKRDDCGAFNLFDHRLTLRREQGSSELAASTFLHELLHAAWRTVELQEKASEERAVGGLSTCLAQIFRDNQAVLTWLQKTLAK